MIDEIGHICIGILLTLFIQFVCLGLLSPKLTYYVNKATLKIEKCNKILKEKNEQI